MNKVKVLWKDTGNREEKGRILVVYMEFRQDVLLLCHDMLAASHQIIKHAKPILRECIFFCYRMMLVLLVLVVLARETKYHTGGYMERVHLDFLGLF